MNPHEFKKGSLLFPKMMATISWYLTNSFSYRIVYTVVLLLYNMIYEMSIVCMSIPDALQGKLPQPRHRKHTVSVGLGSNHDLKVNQDIILPTDSG